MALPQGIGRIQSRKLQIENGIILSRLNMRVNKLQNKAIFSDITIVSKTAIEKFTLTLMKSINTNQSPN